MALPPRDRPPLDLLRLKQQYAAVPGVSPPAVEQAYSSSGGKRRAAAAALDALAAAARKEMKASGVAAPAKVGSGSAVRSYDHPNQAFKVEYGDPRMLDLDVCALFSNK